MDFDPTTDLAEQLTWHWDSFVRPHLEGLTDAEHLWEPVPGAWSIRPRGQARSSHPLGAGAFLLDHAVPEPTPPPFTTIAWRIGHLVGVFGIRASNHFGFDGGLKSYAAIDYQASPVGALAQLDRAYAAWTAGVARLDAAALSAPVGPAEGPFAEHPMATLVLHISREAIHHAAEILTIRDLYRAAGGPATISA